MNAPLPKISNANFSISHPILYKECNPSSILLLDVYKNIIQNKEGGATHSKKLWSRPILISLPFFVSLILKTVISLKSTRNKILKRVHKVVNFRTL